MSANGSTGESVGSRLVFATAGAVTGTVASWLGVGGLWIVPVAVLGLVVVGECYRYLTDETQDGE